MTHPLKHSQIWFWLSVALAGLIAILFFFIVDIEALLLQLQQLNWWYGTLATICLLVGYALYTNRWQHLLSLKPGFWHTFHAGNVGHLMNMWFPSRTGEVGRTIILSRRQALPLPEVTSSVVVERGMEQILRFVALMLLIILGMPIDYIDWLLPLIIVLVGLILVSLWLVNKYKRVIIQAGPRLLGRLPGLSQEKAQQAIDTLFKGLGNVISSRNVTLGLILSGIMWGVFVGYHYLILVALDLNFASKTMWLICFATMLVAPPSAATKPGIYQALIVPPLTLLGLNPVMLTAYALVGQGFQILFTTGFGLWGLLRYPGFSLQTLHAQAEAQTTDVSQDTHGS